MCSCQPLNSRVLRYRVCVIVDLYPGILQHEIEGKTGVVMLSCAMGRRNAKQKRVTGLLNWRSAGFLRRGSAAALNDGVPLPASPALVVSPTFPTRFWGAAACLQRL